MSIAENPHPYIDQNGCHNCNLCFVMEEYDSGNTYYCLHDAPPRPICGSILMGEGFDFGDDLDDYEKWEEWEKGKKVNSWGICGKWEKKEIEKIEKIEEKNNE